ncbi:uncharacterized protein [Solanum tuberosum]|uniref:uncharacterized protein n=1 Tax=Solanum tuberosum TaxID=4113 RepID=UPI00073A0919|nr:PREDICTED: uncharacterized protein LOC102581022 [Solanum tuberosum]
MGTTSAVKDGRRLNSSRYFSWLLVKSLKRFRCVSKFHNSIVLEPNFVDLHLSNYSKINRGDTKLIACVDDICYAIEDHHDEEDGNATKYHQIDNFRNIYGICISGIIYRVSLDPDYSIVAFDVKSEIFTSITMSIELCRSFSDCDNMLIEVNGKLGMMKYSDYLLDYEIYLWVFEEDEEWKHEILHFPLEREPNEFYFDPFMIRKYGAEEIVFAIHITWRSHDDVLAFYIYDMKNKSWRHFEVQKFPGKIERIFTYSETLFSPKYWQCSSPSITTT